MTGRRQITTEEFIAKSRKVHGDKYDYSHTTYFRALRKVTIVCPTHGLFMQTPNGHLTGQGCPACGGKLQMTTAVFVDRARKAHGTRYDYSRVEYVNSKTKVTIICREHGPFAQISDNHLQGAGCIRCGKAAAATKIKSTTGDFVFKARKVHGERYDYSQVEYVGMNADVTIICLAHGLFKQRAGNHLMGSGCPTCASAAAGASMTKSTDEFVSVARSVHGDRYDYSRAKYVRCDQKVTVICHIHGPFEQRPGDHITGTGCTSCYVDSQRSNTEEFVSKARTTHGDKYHYSRVEYTGVRQKVTIVCPDHGPFDQKPNDHLNGAGCPFCAKSPYSQKCIQWLTRLAEEQNINIQHAENGGEFRVPGTRWKADGYCAETNTIYEFHGDIWHGNPLVFNAADYCNPFNRTTTAGQLHQQTTLREEKIRSLGYNLVVIWESEFDNHTI